MTASVPGSAPVKQYNTTVSRLREGQRFRYRGDLCVAKAVKPDGRDICISYELLDDNGDDLGLFMERVAPTARVRVVEAA